MSTSRSVRKKSPPHFDDFTRWWSDNVGGLPTPEEVRKFRPRLERSGLLRSEDEYIDRVAADLLLADGGVGAWDPFREAKAARAKGIVLEGTPAFEELVRLRKLGLARKTARKKRKDPGAVKKAISAKADSRLRKVPAKAAKSRSKVRRTKAGRNEERDRKILKEIHGFLKVGVGVRFTASRVHLVGSPPKLTSGVRTTAYDPVIWLPLWDKASVPLRAMAMGVAAAEHGAIDFTAHLGDTGINYALRGRGEQFARRIYRRIKDALQLNCPKHGFDPPQFMFFVEQGIGERPHLHGVIIAPPLKRHHKNLREILRKAIGEDWKATARLPSQIEFGILYEPAGWVHYITKYLELTATAVGDNLFASSRQLTRQGRKWFEDHRSSSVILLPGRAIEIRSK